MSNCLRPHGLQPARLLCSWDSPGKNTGVGCHSFLQGIFLTQASNLGLLHCRQVLYHLSHQGNPIEYWILCNSTNVPPLEVNWEEIAGKDAHYGVSLRTFLQKLCSCSLFPAVQTVFTPPKIKSLTVSVVSSSICHDMMRPDAMILVF